MKKIFFRKSLKISLAAIHVTSCGAKLDFTSPPVESAEESDPADELEDEVVDEEEEEEGDDGDAGDEDVVELEGELSLAYQDSTNANALVAITEGSEFPATIGDAGAGVFNLEANCPNTADVDFDFTITNDGEGTLESNGTPIVTVTKTTDYTSGVLNGAAGDRVFSIVTQPTFPLAPGATTTFTLRLANTDNTRCALGVQDPDRGAGFSIETASVVINTNDPTHPAFSADLNLFGNS